MNRTAKHDANWGLALFLFALASQLFGTATQLPFAAEEVSIAHATSAAALPCLENLVQDRQDEQRTSSSKKRCTHCHAGCARITPCQLGMVFLLSSPCQCLSDLCFTVTCLATEKTASAHWTSRVTRLVSWQLLHSTSMLGLLGPAPKAWLCQNSQAKLVSTST